MRIALYEAESASNDPHPFGDSRVTQLASAALELAGHRVDRVPAETEQGSNRSGDAAPGDHDLDRIAAAFVSSAHARPDAWISSRIGGRFDAGIGRRVCDALGIPHILLQPRIDRIRGAERSDDTIFLRQAIADANATFVLSSAYTAIVREQVPAHADRVIVLPPFVDLDAVMPATNNRQTGRALLAIKHQLPTDVPWLVAAGPMATDHDLDSYRILAQAMVMLTALDWRLIIAGAGSCRAEVEALLGRVPVRRHRILMIGTPAELMAVLAAGDMFVWPSVDESLSLAAIDAQAAGLAVVAGKSAAMQDVVADSRTGMLTEPGNAASFGNAVGFLLRHPEFRRSYAERGFDWVARNFDLRVVASQLDATLHRVVRLAGSSEATLPVRAID